MDVGFYYYEPVTPVFEVRVGETGGSQPLYASDLEVREVVGVVGYALRVGLGVPDAQDGFVGDYRPWNSALRFSMKALMPSLESSVAKSRAN